ncbi:PsbP-related protein [Streptomyces niveus]|uniref:PsbP-related protein n=1 Tax=Streptomyces niveus TaxID=193462 RepID=UPI003415638C
MRRTLVISLAALTLTTAVVAGCGNSGGSSAASGTTKNNSPAKPAPAESNPAGDIPDDQAYVAYTPAKGGFSVKVPEGWSRTSSGNAVTFTDKLNRIEVSSVNAPTPPTAGSVTSTVVPTLKKQVPNFSSGRATAVTRPAGKGVLLTYKGDSAPDPVTGKVVHDSFERYSFHKGGKEVDLTLSGPVGADNVDPWKIVSESLRWQ